MTRPTNVILVEDHTLMREGIKSLLADSRSLRITGEAANGEDALRQIAGTLPDVVLMDINLPDQDGIQVTRKIRARWPGVGVIILTMYTDSQFIRGAIEAGAAGYMTKSVSRQELVDAITLVRQGQVVFPRSAMHLIASWEQIPRPRVSVQRVAEPPSPRVERLSEREIEVLDVLAEGCTTDEIGARLYISPKTVKTHLQRIYAKLEVSSRLQAVVVARRSGILQNTPARKGVRKRE